MNDEDLDDDGSTTGKVALGLESILFEIRKIDNDPVDASRESVDAAKVPETRRHVPLLFAQADALMRHG
jgi:hypothetical protein